MWYYPLGARRSALGTGCRLSHLTPPTSHLATWGFRGLVFRRPNRRPAVTFDPRPIHINSLAPSQKGQGHAWPELGWRGGELLLGDRALLAHRSGRRFQRRSSGPTVNADSLRPLTLMDLTRSTIPHPLHKFPGGPQGPRHRLRSTDRSGLLLSLHQSRLVRVVSRERRGTRGAVGPAFHWV